MLSNSFIQQVKFRWREFRREPSAFYWVVFMPIIWMLALGFAFSEPKAEIYGVGWPADINQSSLAMKIERVLDSSKMVNLYKTVEENLATLNQRGHTSINLQVGEDKLSFSFDKTNPTAQRAQLFVNDLIERSLGRKDIIQTENSYIKAHGLRYVDFLIPGLLGLSIMTSSLFGVGMTIVSNRKENLLKRYLATPMKPYEYITSHIIGRYITLLAEFASVMLTGFIVFKFKVAGSFLSYVILSMLGAASFTAIALLCASRTRSIPVVAGFTNLITLTSMMLSGVFFSVNNLPTWLARISSFLPLTALNNSLRKIALEGLSIMDLGFEVSVLGVYLLISTILSIKAFKWY